MNERTRRIRRGRNGEAVAGPINFGPLANWIGFNLRMAQEATFQAFSRRSQEIGESPGRFAALTLIARNPGISQTELSHASGRDKSSVTPVVEDLVRRGLVARKRERSDRRAYRLNLTPAGKRTLAQHDAGRPQARGQSRPHHHPARAHPFPGRPEEDRGGD